MNSKQKMFAKLAGSLAQAANQICRSLVKPKPVSRTKEQIREFINTLDLGVNPVLSDRLFYVDTWDKWLKAITIDWTNLHKYIPDSHDCNNFADSFNARMAEIYGWNTAGRLSVELRNPKTGAHIGYHRASIIIALVNGELTAFCYDPMEKMRDQYDKIEDAFIRINDWQYVPNYISFN